MGTGGAYSPIDNDPAVAATAVPHTTRAPNCTGVFRLAVLSS